MLDKREKNTAGRWEDMASEEIRFKNFESHSSLLQYRKLVLKICQVLEFYARKKTSDFERGVGSSSRSLPRRWRSIWPTRWWGLRVIRTYNLQPTSVWECMLFSHKRARGRLEKNIRGGSGFESRALYCRSIQNVEEVSRWLWWEPDECGEEKTCEAALN